MELKLYKRFIKRSLIQVLIVPFMELKHDRQKELTMLSPVLIVPFMELKL